MSLLINKKKNRVAGFFNAVYTRLFKYIKEMVRFRDFDCSLLFYISGCITALTR